MKYAFRSAVLTSAAACALAAGGLAGSAQAAPAPAPAPAAPKLVIGPKAVSGTTPFPNCTAGGPGTVHPGAEVEPWIAVNPRDPGNIVTEWQQDRWSNGGAHSLVAGVTHDFGKHWKQVVVPKISRCAGGNYDRASDPGVTFAANGDLYAISLSVDHFDPNVGFTTSAILISKSTNGGDTWSDPVTAKYDNDPNGVFFNDKELIQADPHNPKLVYAIWDRSDDRGSQPIWFTRTTDGGKTWEPARIIHDPTAPGATDPRFTIGNQIVVEPDGTLVDTYWEGSNSSLDEGGEWGHKDQHGAKKNPAAVVGNHIQVIRSSDHGQTWSAPVAVADTNPAPIVDPNAHQGLRTADVIAHTAVDQHTGRLYITWQDASAATSGAGILISSSTDQGRTWTKPIKVNKTPDSVAQGTGQAFTPAVDVSSTGAVAVTYYDFRKDVPGTAVNTDYWAVTCTGAACASNPAKWHEQHVAGSFDVTLAPLAGGLFLGDYMGLAHVGPVFVSAFTQTHNLPANQQDIYIAGITH